MDIALNIEFPFEIAKYPENDAVDHTCVGPPHHALGG